MTRHRMGTQGAAARCRRNPADQHGPRRHQGRLRPGADARRRRCGRYPVIASGGVGNLDHLADGVSEGHADAVLARDLPFRRIHRAPGQGTHARTRHRGSPVSDLERRAAVARCAPGTMDGMIPGDRAGCRNRPRADVRLHEPRIAAGKRLLAATRYTGRVPVAGSGARARNPGTTRRCSPSAPTAMATCCCWRSHRKAASPAIRAGRAASSNELQGERWAPVDPVLKDPKESTQNEHARHPIASPKPWPRVVNADPETSYTAKMFAGGPDSILKKIGEKRPRSDHGRQGRQPPAHRPRVGRCRTTCWCS